MGKNENGQDEAQETGELGPSNKRSEVRKQPAVSILLTVEDCWRRRFRESRSLLCWDPGRYASS
jgi:hypothetical protein